jgi:mycofactocin precursor
VAITTEPSDQALVASDAAAEAAADVTDDELLEEDEVLLEEISIDGMCGVY